MTTLVALQHDDKPVLSSIEAHRPFVSQLPVTILGASQCVEASERHDNQGQKNDSEDDVRQPQRHCQRPAIVSVCN